MGILKDFMGIFKTSTKAVDTAADVVKMGARGIDAIWYTDEEKAGDAAKSAGLLYKGGELSIEYMKTTQNESSARSLSRRYLAWASFGLGIFLTLYALLMRTVAAFWPSMRGELIAVAKFALGLLNIWWPIILAAGVFYFGVAALRARGKK